MKNFLPTLVLAACSDHCLPRAEFDKCRPEMQVVEKKCENYGPLIELNPELKAVQECFGGHLEAVCRQNTILEPRQVEWTYNQ